MRKDKVLGCGTHTPKASLESEFELGLETFGVEVILT